MARYIDAEKIVYHEHTVCAGHGEYYVVRSVTDDKINEIPTADVDEVRHGYWKGAGMGDFLCSHCWSVFSGGNRFKHCPNCGAKMDGDHNGQ